MTQRPRTAVPKNSNNRYDSNVRSGSNKNKTPAIPSGYDNTGDYGNNAYGSSRNRNSQTIETSSSLNQQKK